MDLIGPAPAVPYINQEDIPMIAILNATQVQQDGQVYSITISATTTDLSVQPDPIPFSWTGSINVTDESRFVYMANELRTVAASAAAAKKAELAATVAQTQTDLEALVAGIAAALQV